MHTTSILTQKVPAESSVTKYPYLIFEISNCSLRTHLKALAIWGRNIIAATPFMNLFFAKPVSSFLLVKTLQFTIP